MTIDSPDPLPFDPKRLSMATSAINRQISYQMQLKQREMKAIKRLMAESVAQLNRLQKILDGHEDEDDDDGEESDAESAIKDASVGRKKLELDSSASESEGTRKRRRVQAGVKPTETPQTVYALRSDGVFVKLSCPECGRNEFSNRIGFINHCRYSHQLKYSSMEEWTLHCGTVVEDESEIPEDDPCRQEKIVAHLKQLDSLSSHVTQDGDETKFVVESTDGNKEKNPSNVKSELFHSLDHLSDPPTSDDEETVTADAEHHIAADGSCQSDTGNGNISQSAQKFIRYNASTATNQAPNHIPLTCLGLPSRHIKSEDSRFYIKRRIVVGNVSKYLTKESRGLNSRLTHKWMVYVQNVDNLNVSEYVDKVVFYLHPSYRPDDVIEVTKAPFQLIRYGWGEFPIRVQIHFKQPELNHPINVIHFLELDKGRSGQQMQGPERAFDVELDRLTVTSSGSLIAAVDSKLFEDSTTDLESGDEQKPSTEDEDLLNLDLRSDDNLNQEEPTKSDGKQSQTKATKPNQPSPATETPFCRFCGRHRLWHPLHDSIIKMDEALAAAPGIPREILHDSAGSFSEISREHKELKCQFKSSNRKGKLKTLYCSLTPYLDVVDNPGEEMDSSDRHLAQIRKKCDQLIQKSLLREDISKVENDEDHSCQLKLLHQLRAVHEIASVFPAFPQQPPTDDLNTKEPHNELSLILLALTKNFIKALVKDSLHIVETERRIETEDWTVEQRIIERYMVTLKIAKNHTDIPPPLPNQKQSEEKLETVSTVNNKEASIKIFTPYHVQRALFAQRFGRWDFLTNSFQENISFE